MRTPIYAEMVNLINGEQVDFAEFRFPMQQTRNQLDNYNFFNGRPITRSMLAWWAMQHPEQSMPRIDTAFEIEHIYARNRNSKEDVLSNPKNVEQLGNKSLLEKRINIRASDYRFVDKRKYYQGFINNKGKKTERTIIAELYGMNESSQPDFSEKDILARTSAILDAFCKYLKDENLIQE